MGNKRSKPVRCSMAPRLATPWWCVNCSRSKRSRYRYGPWQRLITTHQTITQWGHVFGDEMIASAVLDRVLHHSHTLLIQGDGFRLKQKKRAGLLVSKPQATEHSGGISLSGVWGSVLSGA